MEIELSFSRESESCMFGLTLALPSRKHSIRRALNTANASQAQL